jgi:hypothetical protein
MMRNTTEMILHVVGRHDFDVARSAAKRIPALACRLAPELLALWWRPCCQLLPCAALLRFSCLITKSGDWARPAGRVGLK